MRIMFLILSLISTSALAHDYQIGEISIAHPISYPTTGRSGVGYMMITNTGPQDRLIAVEADFPRVMIHKTTTVDGIASMTMVHAVDVPQNGMAHFQPGGLHVMFMGLSAHLMVGDEIPATLVFENAGRLQIVFKVEARPDTENAGEHSNH
ncbi:MAG: copper chaperone PCu(A)C [Planktomarina sp.]